MVAEAVEQVTGLALFASAAAFRAVGSSRRIPRVAGLDDAMVAIEKALRVGGRQGAQSARACRGDGLLDGQQVIHHLLGPRLILLLPQKG